MLKLAWGGGIRAPQKNVSDVKNFFCLMSCKFLRVYVLVRLKTTLHTILNGTMGKLHNIARNLAQLFNTLFTHISNTNL